MSQVLSQNEVDALLSAVSDGEIETEVEEEQEEDSSIITYDLTGQDRIIRGRMPTLDIVYERFIRGFRVTLSTALRRIASINVSSTDLLKFGEFMNTLPLPSCMNIIRFESLRGFAIIVVESKLAYALVDSFFGGSDRPFTRIEGKEFTAIELSIIKKIVEGAIDDLEEAWSPVHKMNINFVRSEVNPQFVGIVPPTDVIIATTFEIELENASGVITLVIPYATLEPIKQKLTSGFQAEQEISSTTYVEVVKQQLMETTVKLKVDLGVTEITFADLINLSEGDVIPLNQDADGELVVEVEGAPKYKGYYGESRGNVALQITKLIEPKEVITNI
jgi:flagellar motor switch protein FliM